MNDNRPHSRACGWQSHPHGSRCSANCPTCHGLDEQAEAFVKAVMDELALLRLMCEYIKRERSRIEAETLTYYITEEEVTCP